MFHEPGAGNARLVGVLLVPRWHRKCGRWRLR